MKVTIQDIADALGVSRNTVSKAINNSEGIADATRERILQKAVEMGYKQLSFALSIRSQDNPDSPSPEYKGEIALFSQKFLDSSHFASLMMDKLQQEMALLGYTINTHRVTEENIANMTLPITFIQERACAILCIEMFDWNYCEMICKLDMPTLFVDGPVKFKGRSLPCDQLYMNNSDAITRFVNDMVDAGCKTIGYVGNYDHCQSFYERYIAYRNAVTMSGLTYEEKYFIYYDEDPAKKLPRLKAQLASLDKLPDVFVCSNDFSAIDTIRVLRELGKDVPRDVKILGFDDSEESRKHEPQISTIHIHTQVMAFAALQLLISRMKQPWLDNRIMYTECDLIYRESAKID